MYTVERKIFNDKRTYTKVKTFETFEDALLYAKRYNRITKTVSKVEATIFEGTTKAVFYLDTDGNTREIKENNKDIITDDNLHSEAFETAPPEVAPDKSNRFIDVKIIDEPNEKDFIFTVGGYSFQFRKLKDAIKWAKKWAREQNKDLTIYKKGVAVCRVRAKPQRLNKINIPA